MLTTTAASLGIYFRVLICRCCICRISLKLYFLRTSNMIIILVQSVNFLTNYDTTQQLCVVIISEKKSSKKLMHQYTFSYLVRKSKNSLCIFMHDNEYGFSRYLHLNYTQQKDHYLVLDSSLSLKYSIHLN
ncbi:hypothetical protein JOE49_003774 [Paenibacillus sp. PvR133]|nr:hypothetical protein [Paenibacillus sp. PvR133]